MPQIKIDYLNFVLLHVTRDAIEYDLTYTMIEREYEGDIYDINNLDIYKIKISLTGPRRAIWMENGFDENNIPNACFEFGRRFLIDLIKSGKVEREESLQIEEENVNFNITNLQIMVGQSEYIATANNPLKYF